MENSTRRGPSGIFMALLGLCALALVVVMIYGVAVSNPELVKRIMGIESQPETGYADSMDGMDGMGGMDGMDDMTGMDSMDGEGGEINPMLRDGEGTEPVDGTEPVTDGEPDAGIDPEGGVDPEGDADPAANGDPDSDAEPIGDTDDVVAVG